MFRKVANYFSQKDFTGGNLKPNINLDRFGDIITIICYEILFSGEINKRISKETNLLINITNDAWFGKTVGPYQHLALAQIKAVELGLPIVRVANTGISAFISPFGEELVKIDLNQEDAKTIELMSKLKSTYYRKFGDSVFFFLLFLLFVVNKKCIKEGI